MNCTVFPICILASNSIFHGYRQLHRAFHPRYPFCNQCSSTPLPITQTVGSSAHSSSLLMTSRLTYKKMKGCHSKFENWAHMNLKWDLRSPSAKCCSWSRQYVYRLGEEFIESRLKNLGFCWMKSWTWASFCAWKGNYLGCIKIGVVRRARVVTIPFCSPLVRPS